MDNQKCSNDEIDLRKYIEVMIRRKKMILAVLLICVISATIASFLMPKAYETSAIIKIDNITQPLISKEESIIKLKTESFLESVILQLNLNIKPSELEEMIKVEDIRGTSFVKIKVQHLNPDLAVKICNVIADLSLLENKKNYSERINLVKEEIQQLEKRNDIIDAKTEELNQILLSKPNNPDFQLIQNTLSNYESLRIQLNERIYVLKQELMNFTQPEVFEPAVTAKNIKPNKQLNITLSAILGLFVGILIAFLQEFWEKGKRI